MSKFKVGDKVRIVRVLPGRSPGLSYIGKEFVIAGGSDYDGEPSWHGGDGAASKPFRWKESELELVAPSGPVRTVTRREIVPGEYGIVHVGGNDGKEVSIDLNGRPTCYTADELRSAAMIFSQLAEVLDENKEDGE